MENYTGVKSISTKNSASDGGFTVTTLTCMINTAHNAAQAILRTHENIHTPTELIKES
jgi:hypothetical protein